MNNHALSSCAFCKVPLFIKAKVYAKSALAPLTPEEEMRDALIETTGETYVLFEHRFCPTCGRKVE